jgi:hypothetical protein
MHETACCHKNTPRILAFSVVTEFPENKGGIFLSLIPGI